MPEEDVARQPEPRWAFTLSGSLLSLVLLGVVGFLRRYRYVRVLVGIVGGGLLILGFADVLILKIEWLDGMLALLASGAIIVLATISGPDFELVLAEREAEAEQEEAEAVFAESPDPARALDVDLKRLNLYYEINQNQARSSFRWSLAVMTIGFTTIIAGIWLFYLSPEDQPDKLLASLSTAAGIVINLISALFLYMHNKANARSLVYFNKLLEVQRVALALKIAETSDETRADVLGRVIDHLLPGGSKVRSTWAQADEPSAAN